MTLVIDNVTERGHIILMFQMFSQFTLHILIYLCTSGIDRAPRAMYNIRNRNECTCASVQERDIMRVWARNEIPLQHLNTKTLAREEVKQLNVAGTYGSNA